MKAFFKHYFRFMLIFTLIYFFILILVNLISGTKEIVPTFLDCLIYGFLITVYFFIVRFINLKKFNVSVFSDVFFTSNPNINVQSKYNLYELKKMIIKNHKLKILRITEESLKFKKAYNFGLYSQTFEVSIIRSNSDYYEYSITTLGWNSIFLDDLGSNLKLILLVKKMLTV